MRDAARRSQEQFAGCLALIAELSQQNEKATRANRAASSSRENSSNGQAVKTFWENLMRGQTGVSSNFLIINIFIFNTLQKFPIFQKTDKKCHSVTSARLKLSAASN
ncbi:MAG: hypothetical protein ACRD2R_00570 [Terriglobales bacterium]